MENKHTISDLYQMQSLSLDSKIRMSQFRYRAWIEEFGEDGVYVSFSGGKDSEVLLDMIRQDYPRVKALFVNTGLEYPKIREFVKNYENVDIVKPEMTFREVILKYGYPVISKEIASKIYEVRRSIAKGNTNTIRYRQLMGIERKKNGELSEFNCQHYQFLLDAPFNISDMCCEIMKKRPARKYNQQNNVVPIIATMADESRQRRTKWIIHGCNAFTLKHPESAPISFWTEQDVLEYIYRKHLPIAEPYGKVVRIGGGGRIIRQSDIAQLAVKEQGAFLSVRNKK
uniref:phosphoadenosine phosphosulfate reductase domain-containing protein n=1 Tax=Enterocloster clostridioformis TaxID=1531 RepID=UPI002676669E|nr:phosphoadenosine phosphosulfate reductase family protein [Enterocloster clostridioformis]